MRLLFSIAIILFYSNFGYSQDDCNTATTIMVGFPVVTGDNSGGTPDLDFSVLNGVCNSSQYEASIWYTFVAPTDIIEVIFQANTLNDAVMIITDDCDPGSASYFYASCDAPGIHAFCDMTAGEQYYIMVSSSLADAGTFNIDINNYVLADTDCVDNGDEQNLVTLGEIPNNYCSQDGTVWYYLDAQGFGSIDVTLMGSDVGWTLDDPDIYEAWLNGCPNNGGIDISSQIPNFDCLGPGDFIYLLVGNDGPEYGAFGYSITWSPGDFTNDVCANASDEGVVTCQAPIFGSAGDEECIGQDAEAVCNPGTPGVWYTFEVADDIPLFDVTGGDFDLFSGDFCSDLDFIACSGSSDVFEVENDGSTFYVLLYESGFFGVNSSVPPPSNDNCMNADQSLNVSTTAIGTTLCASPNYNFCGGDPSDFDYSTVWFDYQVLNNGTTLNIEVTGTGSTPLSTSDMSIMVYQDCGANLANEYSVTNSNGFICGANEYMLSCLPAGDYYIEIGSSQDGAGEFEIEISVMEEPVPNDYCENPGDPFDQEYLTNVCAGSEFTFCNINAFGDHDVWFEYELQNVPSDITISVTEEDYGNGEVEQISIAAFLDCDMTPIDPADNQVGIGCDFLGQDLVMHCVTASTLFFVVSSESGSEGDFEIDIIEDIGSFTYSPPQDEYIMCEGSPLFLDAGAGFEQYDWFDQNLEYQGSGQMFEVTEDGFYTVEVSSNGCIAIGEIEVFSVPPPEVDIIGQLLVCNNEDGDLPSVINFDELSMNSSDGEWLSLDLDQSILDDLTAVSFVGIAEGSYQFVFTTDDAEEPCVNISDTLLITLIECLCPTPILTDSISFCNDLLQINLNTWLIDSPLDGEWTFTNGPVVLAVANDSLVDMIGSLEGTYLFEYQFDDDPGNGCPLSDSLIIQLIDPQQAPILNIPDVCNMLDVDNGHILNLDELIITINGYWLDPMIVGLDFSDPSNLDFQNTALGTYPISLVLDHSLIPCENDTLVFNLNVIDCSCPELQMGLNDLFCTNNGSLNLNDWLMLNSPEGEWGFVDGPTILDVSNDSIVDLNFAQTGEYFYSYSYSVDPGNGCPLADSISIMIFEPQITSLVSIPDVCNSMNPIGPHTLDLHEHLIGLNAYWIDPQIPGLDFSDPTALDFQGVISATYQLQLVLDNSLTPCENDTINYDLTVIECICPALEINPQDVVCNDLGEYSLDLNIINVEPGSWSAIGNSIVVNADLIDIDDSLSGDYMFEYALENPIDGCDSFATFVLTIIPHLEINISDTLICNAIMETDDPILDLTELSSNYSGFWMDESAVLLSSTIIDFTDETPGDAFTFIFESDSAIDPCMNTQDTIMITVKDCNCEDPEVVVPPTLCSSSTSQLDLNDYIITDLSGIWSVLDQPTGANVQLLDGVCVIQDEPEGLYEFVFSITDAVPSTCQTDWNLQLMLSIQEQASIPTTVQVCDTVSEVHPFQLVLNDLITSGNNSGIWLNETNDTINGLDTISFLDQTIGSQSFSYTLQNDLPCDQFLTTLQVEVLACNEIPTEPEIPDDDLILPNIFSPNGDGQNDILSFEYSDYTIHQMAIYDRWGNLAFFHEGEIADNESLFWDGRINGKNASEGVYVIHLSYSILGGDLNQKTGSVTLIR